MAEDKANKALNQANPINTIKVYLSGENPCECTHHVVEVPSLKKDTHPWLVKWYTDEMICHQFVDAGEVYKHISREMNILLDAVIVNGKQRESVSALVDRVLYELLMRDRANENNIVV